MTTPFAALDRPDGTRIYPIAPEGSDEVVELPNITGIIGLLDPKHVCEWKLKVAMLGAALREDIAVQVAAGHLLPEGPPRNSELRRVVELAITAGHIIEKGHLTNDRGSAYHSLTERLDDLVPSGQVAQVDALPLPRAMSGIAKEYVAAMAGVEIVRSEFTVCSFIHGFAGTSDRIIRFQPLDQWTAAFDQYDLGRGCFAFDNKFGTVHDTVAMQLAAVTIAETIYDAQTGTHTPLPADLRADIGFVFNPDKGLLPVDLTGAADAFLGAVAIRRWLDRKPVHPKLGARNGHKNVEPLADGSPAPGPATAMPDLQAPDPAAGDTTAATAVAEQPGQPGPVSAHPFDPEPDQDGPAPIARPLALVTAALAPADPFAGLPDTNGTPQIDRAAKRAWLMERRETLIAVPGGREALAKRWPPGLPTLPQTDQHSADQLALIERALITAEAQVHAPFPDRPDPTDPANIVVANDDPQVLALVRRGMALPPDLEQSVFAAARHEKIPRLSTGRITQAHLTVLDRLIATAEAEAGPRRERITNALKVAAEHGVSEASLCAALGHAEAAHLHGPSLALLDDLVDAVASTDRVIVERDGALVVDQPAVVLAAYGNDRRRVLSAGQRAAKANGIEPPKDSDAVLAHPVLAAVLAAV